MVTAAIALLTNSSFTPSGWTRTVVIDEQPRYHLPGCRSIRGRETIPLSAKEAVEYEFTPCEVCSPVRVLSARNRAASKS